MILGKDLFLRQLSVFVLFFYVVLSQFSISRISCRRAILKSLAVCCGENFSVIPFYAFYFLVFCVEHGICCSIVLFCCHYINTCISLSFNFSFCTNGFGNFASMFFLCCFQQGKWHIRILFFRYNGRYKLASPKNFPDKATTLSRGQINTLVYARHGRDLMGCKSPVCKPVTVVRQEHKY